MLHARFDNVLPGAPERTIFAELVAAPPVFGGFEPAVEVLHVGRIVVSDANDDAAAPATVMNLRVRATFAAGAWAIEPMLRVDNVTDRRYAGSVIVNEANKRYFEPAPGRTWLATVTLRWRG